LEVQRYTFFDLTVWYFFIIFRKKIRLIPKLTPQDFIMVKHSIF